MFVLYAFVCGLIFVFLDLMFFKVYQLESYRIKRYLKKVSKLQFAFGRKTPLIFTNRIKRLIFCDFFAKFLIFLMFFWLFFNFWLFLIFGIFIIFSPYFVILSFLISLPVEELVKLKFIKRAKKKLSKCACKVIAITGSFGKTSTKNILYQILREQFKVTATPKSFNTPMGICRTILEELKEDDDFLIVEFGARQVGDIDKLAKLVGVDFGIITPIGDCHLETFGTIERIENTKYELCRHAKDYVVFNGNSRSSKKLYDRYPRKKYLVAQQNSFCYAKNIKTDKFGSKFDLFIDQRRVNCRTSLLGEANVDNICVASAISYLLGEELVNIKRGIDSLKATSHRLELLRSDFVTVIDDSYNSNFDGFKQALKTLSSFEGRKIVVSPGIVELGKKQAEINTKIGKEVSKVADIFVIMNKTNQGSLVAGASGCCEIFYATTREEQKKLLKQILQKGDIVLFENDFPDNLR